MRSHYVDSKKTGPGGGGWGGGRGGGEVGLETEVPAITADII